MGGGETKVNEAAKRLRPRRRGAEGDGSGGGEAATDLTVPICEREQTVPLRLLVPTLQAGTAVRVVLGDPPAVVVGGRTVGHIAGRRVAATLVACLNDGYEIQGEIVEVDADRGQAAAAVAGFRSA